ncbi:tryptophanyl-tRNA synthetase [Nematocida displodere]|uniref:tryptophan--tRNA ligase n=1 Tax=Nematocida displodere TaxID=1805483 RepID=A0A177EF74_9MICR|nr:tryptophanyl-tRNA synthetase [Nematocida displodere]
MDTPQQVITPWEVESSKPEEGIDYEKVIRQFGCQKVTPEMIADNELTHLFFRRGIVFAHRDFNVIIEKIKQGKSIYLYTGRGPSSESMHLGHAVPFMFCRYLQERFNCKIVIQMTDDEKYIWKDIALKDSINYTVENAKDIISFGFDPKKTFIFSNTLYGHTFTETTLTIEKSIMVKDFMKVFGFTDTCKVGQLSFPSRQMSPCFASSFPSLIEKDACCLIPCSIDQDPYFRLARDISHKINSIKPATIYTYFLPALQGTGVKMSASSSVSSIYLNDTPAEIKKKINKHAFSGGRDTLEEHRKHGGDPDVDIAYQYLRFFLEDDDQLKAYEEGYRNGSILSGEMKKACIETLQLFIKDFQARRAAITPEVLQAFFTHKLPSPQ